MPRNGPAFAVTWCPCRIPGELGSLEMGPAAAPCLSLHLRWAHLVLCLGLPAGLQGPNSKSNRTTGSAPHSLHWSLGQPTPLPSLCQALLAVRLVSGDTRLRPRAALLGSGALSSCPAVTPPGPQRSCCGTEPLGKGAFPPAGEGAVMNEDQDYK